MAQRLNLSAETTNTIIRSADLLSELDSIRENEVGIDNEEFVDGMIAVAVPVKDSQGRFFAAVAFHAPVVRMTMDDALKFVPRLRSAADDLANLIEN